MAIRDFSWREIKGFIVDCLLMDWGFLSCILYSFVWGLRVLCIGRYLLLTPHVLFNTILSHLSHLITAMYTVVQGDILFLHMSKDPIRTGEIVVFNVDVSIWWPSSLKFIIFSFHLWLLGFPTLDFLMQSEDI